MKIASTQAGLTIRSSVPSFKYKFKKADDPIEVASEHAEKVLRSSNFYEYGKTTKKTKKATKTEDTQ